MKEKFQIILLLQKNFNKLFSSMGLPVGNKQNINIGALQASLQKNMKQSKNKPSVTNVVVNSITTLNPDNSNNLAYSTQGRVLKGMCYSFTNDIKI